jgi:hypothetical protein
MLVYVNCVSGETEYNVAINPSHVVSVIEIKPSELVTYKSLITLTTGREHFTNENYLELVGRFSAALN